MNLRPYQIAAYNQARAAFRDHRTVCLSMPTGSGKTVTLAQMVKSATERGNRCWLVVPRNELMLQGSDHLKRAGIKHGRISPGFSESNAFDVHVVSSHTLIRRWDKIKRPPEFIVWDECHLHHKRQVEAQQMFPNTFFLGLTATPERLDGKPMSDIYETLITGVTMQQLIDDGYLAPIRYFCPPIKGLRDLHYRGIDYDASEVEKLLEKRRIYGKAVDHYRRYADCEPCIVFCRSIKSAEETADRFNAAGYRFLSIDGRMNSSKRKTILDGLRTGELHGVTSVDLLVIGLDVPRVSCVIMLRPTLSKTVFHQSIGRGSRPHDGKRWLTVLDHVGNLREHGHPLQHQDWNFNGRTVRAKQSGESVDSLKLCTRCFLYYTGSRCDNCGIERTTKPRANIREVDGRLVEVKGPIKLKDRTDVEKIEISDRIRTAKKNGDLRELLDIAEKLGRRELWVYHQLCEDRYTVNHTLLHEIARIKGYKPGWAWFAGKKLKEGR